MEEQVRALVSGCEVRGIDEDTRTATFVAATEGGVDTYRGKEHLRMSGVKLDRFRKNPVILDTHDRFTAGAVIGKATVKKEGRVLLADITFAETARAEEVWQLVRGGFINAVSVGFIPNREKTVRIAEGEKHGRGEGQITGPAVVVEEWELFEISIVPVPADPDAIRRALESDLPAALVSLHGLLERLIPQAEKEPEMAKEKETPEEQRAATPPETPAPPAPENVTELASERTARDLKALRESVQAITPRGFEAVADRCITEGKTLEETRAALIAALNEKGAPVGTPDTTPGGENRSSNELTVENVSDEDLIRAFGR